MSGPAGEERTTTAGRQSGRIPAPERATASAVLGPGLAMAAAADAAHEWASAEPAVRARALSAVADALRAARAELVPIAAAETSLGEARLDAELDRTTFQLGFFADRLRSGEFLDVRIDCPDDTWPTGPRPDLRRCRTALGPVLVFAAGNFPFAFGVAGGDTASALAAGCPVVVKAHPGHPRLARRTARIIGRALAEAGAPDGVFALVEGEAEGVEVLRHPGLRAAAFTGSERGGLALARIASERPEPLPFYGELGSANPVVVTAGAADARAAEIAQGYADSLTLGAGQFCTNPGLLFVPAGHRIVYEIAWRVREVPTAQMLNERIAQGYLLEARRLAELAGVRKLVWPEDEEALAPRLLALDGSAFQAGLPDTARECFGPLGLVVLYERLEDVRKTVSALPGQLTAALHAEPREVSELTELAVALTGRSGRFLWNEWPTGVSVTHAMQHGGPFPAATTPTITSVGSAAIERFLRPVAYQSCPAGLLPPPLRDDNPWNVPQRIDGGS
ncbi:MULTISPECIES: aldehyde dehydrogenase (NADP(+)) [unclassified Streptomyces]|uniref:aldehyde dehydrogenase (NADP(+)) n=1 Tax=unclassified Streptomyces TaxID=2593676 RepID=UPI00379D3836